MDGPGRTGDSNGIKKHVRQMTNFMNVMRLAEQKVANTMFITL